MNKINMEEYKYQIQTQGFYIIEDFLSNDLCNHLIMQVENELHQYKSYGTQRSELDKHHLHDLVTKYLEIAKLLDNEILDELVGEILGESWIMYAFTSSSCPPNATNYGGRVHVDSPRWISEYPTNVGVIWALDDFTKENGGTKVLVGSHNSDIVPSKEYFDKNAVQVECPKGSLILFNARVVHSTGFNKTDKWRHALTMNACRAYMKQRMDWVRFIPSNIADNLGSRARRIIGYDTRLPTNLEEFFLPEDERLYKANQG
ncbi:MAG TPA: phytanoyl-CoA dioxygenase [Arcobacter sp.]|jgi:ectoine hydroxylase-related dioxygenase (phytanoyl-CoA dioxygenase family)|nr:phytanoyl-CoA dioxygenase [Arcobacter sp.]